MSDYLVLRVVSKVLIPFILLFGLYVQMHGDYGPGGGFQAGVIIAAAFILFGLVFGLQSLNAAVPPPIVLGFVGLGVLIYAGVGIYTVLLGGKFLDYSLLAHDPQHGHHYGIFAVEIGVGITVAAVMLTAFTTFAARGEPLDD
jgi:multicomponent Na+:H+ antiporter subunit B